MKKGNVLLSWLMLFSVIVGQYNYDQHILNQKLCEYSKYATIKYEVTNGKLYCRSSDNSYQVLTKYKSRSKHLGEHKMESK